MDLECDHKVSIDNHCRSRVETQMQRATLLWQGGGPRNFDRQAAEVHVRHTGKQRTKSALRNKAGINAESLLLEHLPK